MSYIEAQLQPGERVLMRVNQGRQWYHFLLWIIGNCLLLPLMFGVFFYFLVPMLGVFIQTELIALIILGFMGFVGISMLFNFLHFLMDEIVLTDRRIIGRAQETTIYTFKKLDIPLSTIHSARLGSVTAPGVTIQRKDGQSNILLRNLKSSKQFILKITELINRSG